MAPARRSTTILIIYSGFDIDATAHRCRVAWHDASLRATLRLTWSFREGALPGMAVFVEVNRRKVGKWVFQLLRDHWGDAGFLVIPSIGRQREQVFRFVRPQSGDPAAWAVLGELSLGDGSATVTTKGAERSLDDFDARELRTTAIVPWLAELMGLDATVSPAQRVDRLPGWEAVGRDLYVASWRMLGLLLRERPDLRMGETGNSISQDALSLRIDTTVVRLNEPIVGRDFRRVRLADHSGAGELVDRLWPRPGQKPTGAPTLPVRATKPVCAPWVAFDPDDGSILYYRGTGGLFRSDLVVGLDQMLAGSETSGAGTIWGAGERKWLVSSEGATWSLNTPLEAAPRPHPDLTHVSLAVAYGAKSIGIAASPDRLLQVRDGRVEIFDYPPPPDLETASLRPSATFPLGADATLGLALERCDWVVASAGSHHQLGGRNRSNVIDGPLPDGHPNSVAIARRTGIAAVFSRRIDIFDLDFPTTPRTLSLGSAHKVAGAFTPDDRYLVVLAADRLIALRPASGRGWVLGHWPAGDDPAIAFSRDGRNLCVAGEGLVVLDWQWLQRDITSCPIIQLDVDVWRHTTP